MKPTTTQKVWGTTTRLFQTDTMAVDLLDVKANGYCSQHYHATKWNRFVVLSGELCIKVCGDPPLVLHPGDATDIPPGLIHNFEAAVDTTAIEVAYVSLQEEDIVRFDTGGMFAQAVSA